MDFRGRGAECATPKFASLAQDYLRLIIFKEQQTQEKL